MDFGIQIQTDEVLPSEYALEQNHSFVTLHDWQRRAVDYFLQRNNAVFEVATGSGKSFCSIEILKRVLQIDPDIRVLIIVPKNVILEETWYNELYDNGISIVDIGLYYGRVKEPAKITLTNMQNVTDLDLNEFDFLIADEVHNYGTKRLLPVLQHKFKYKIGLSATIERMDKAHWDILEAFEYNTFKYSPKQALDEGVLNPFEFTNFGVVMDSQDYEEYEELTSALNSIYQSHGSFQSIMKRNIPVKFRMLKLMNERKQLVNNYPKKFDVINEIVKEHGKDKIIVFNEYNDQTNKCYWHLLELGLKTCVVHSGIPQDVREKNMMDFKRDKFNVMLTSKVLDEGYNLPKIDVGIIMAGNSTAKQTIQRMGRVLRKKKHNSHLYQIYCKETIEEKQSDERGKIFKELCSNYKEKIYYE